MKQIIVAADGVVSRASNQDGSAWWLEVIHPKHDWLQFITDGEVVHVQNKKPGPHEYSPEYAEIDSIVVISDEPVMGTAQTRLVAPGIYEVLPAQGSKRVIDTIPSSTVKHILLGGESIPIVFNAAKYVTAGLAGNDDIRDKAKRALLSVLDPDPITESALMRSQLAGLGSKQPFGTLAPQDTATGAEHDSQWLALHWGYRTGTGEPRTWYNQIHPRGGGGGDFDAGAYELTRGIALQHVLNGRPEDYAMGMWWAMGLAATGIHRSAPFRGCWRYSNGHGHAGTAPNFPPKQEYQHGTEGLAYFAAISQSPFLLDTLRMRFERILAGDLNGENWDSYFGSRIAGEYLRELDVVYRWAWVTADDQATIDAMRQETLQLAYAAMLKYRSVLDLSKARGFNYWLNRANEWGEFGDAPTSPWMLGPFIVYQERWRKRLGASGNAPMEDFANDYSYTLLAAGNAVWADAAVPVETANGDTVIFTRYRIGEKPVDDFHVNRNMQLVGLARMRVVMATTSEERDLAQLDYNLLVGTIQDYGSTSIDDVLQNNPAPVEDVGIDYGPQGLGQIKFWRWVTYMGEMERTKEVVS